MISHSSKLQIDPAKILSEKFFLPSGLSAKQFALAVGINPGRFRKVLYSQLKMNSVFINRISKYTHTSSKFWYLLQLEYYYHNYLNRNKHSFSITPIKYKDKILDLKSLNLSISKGSPGEQLMKYLLEEKISVNQLSKKIKLEDDTIIKILKGYKEVDLRISFKLGSVWRDPIYWIKLQMSFEIEQILNEEILPISIKNQLKRFKRRLHVFNFDKIDSVITNPKHIIIKHFSNHTEVDFCEWCNLLCISKKRMNSILNGRAELSIKMLIKLSVIFGPSIVYWLNLRLNYSVKEVLRLTKKNNVKPYKNEIGLQKMKKKKLNELVLKSVGKNLVDEFLRPLNWQTNEFAKHIGVRTSKLHALIYGSAIIDFDLATRLGLALEIDPKYFLYLQLDYSIKNKQQLPIF